MNLRATTLTLLLVLCRHPGTAAAQQPELGGFEQSSELRVLGANSLLGGVTAGVGALLRGDPPWGAFARGLGGGAVVYAGKRIAVQEWFGAGLVARQVGLAGSSIVANAAAGRGSFDRLAFGFGPVRWYVGKEIPGVRWRVDVPGAALALYWIGWGVVDPSRTFEFEESVSSGALVFCSQNGASGGSFTVPGAIFYGCSPTDPEREVYVRSHERVHLLQFDQSFLSWGDPFEAWMDRRIPALQEATDRFELDVPGLSAVILLGIYAWPEHNDQPWEREAMYLGHSR